MELLPVLFLFLMLGAADGNERPLRVKEGDSVTLHCSIDSGDITNSFFAWKKDDKDVLMYSEGVIKNDQKQFSYNKNDLVHGDASITITGAKLSDRGNYTCLHTTEKKLKNHVVLIVDCILKDRTADKDILRLMGAPAPPTRVCPIPDVKQVKETKDWRRLQCVVRGAFPKPTLEWKDSAGKVLEAEEPQVKRKGDLYDITLLTTVFKSDNYSCVVTQEGICHQIYNDLLVDFPGAAPEPSVTILDESSEWSVLQCVVRGATPEHKVWWQDSSGNILPAKEPQVTERGGSYNVVLQTTVTKSDHYHCVVTQDQIKHQTEAKIYVHVNDAPSNTGWIVAGVLALLLVVCCIIFIVLFIRSRINRSKEKKTKALNESGRDSRLL